MNSKQSASSPHPHSLLSSDFVIRSLRRRLWKAFQEDDDERALRAYQANLEDFKSWLREEEEEGEKAQKKLVAAEGATRKNKRGSLLNRRSIIEKNDDVSTRRGSILRAGLSKPKAKRRSSVKTGDKRVDEQSDLFISIDIQKLKDPILQSLMNPSEPFIADDFLSPYDSYDKPARKDLPDVQKHEREQEEKKQKSRRPRLAAFHIFRRPDELDLLETFAFSSESEPVIHEDTNMTTPLHEAARLGSGDFIRLLLANGGDPNFKNGMARTTLHMCAGGFTVPEGCIPDPEAIEDNSQVRPIGIRAACIPKKAMALMYEEMDRDGKQKGRTKKAVKAVAKIFQSAIRPGASEMCDTGLKQTAAGSFRPVDADVANQLATERMDSVLSILSWIRHETGEGISINAVDVEGRSALHYAAEMGRPDICLAILSNFGAMLTIVDELGAKTACELAADQGHKDLAAQLEARAVLYIDPYGLDDELMATVLTSEMEEENDDGSRRRNLVTPFSWFETLSLNEIEQKRSEKIKKAKTKMIKAVQHWDDIHQTAKKITTMADAAESETTSENGNKLNCPKSDQDTKIPVVEDGENPMSLASRQTAKKIITMEDAAVPETTSENENKLDCPKSDQDTKIPAVEDGENPMPLASRQTAKKTITMKDAAVSETTSENGNKLGCPKSDQDTKIPAVEDGKIPMSLVDDPDKLGNEDTAITPGENERTSGSNPPKNPKNGNSVESVLDEDPSTHTHLQDWHVVRLLSYHRWNISDAVKEIRKDPIEAFQQAGVQFPSESVTKIEGSEERQCPICYDDDISAKEWVEIPGCSHGFCKKCVIDYAKDCAVSKMASASIACPHHDCQITVPYNTLADLLSDTPGVLRRINEADREEFVSSSQDYKFCPHPGCSGIVRVIPQSFLIRNGVDQDLLNCTGAVCVAQPTSENGPFDSTCPLLTYEGIKDSNYNNCRSTEPPRKAHRFCFICGEGMHWPVTCDRLQEWKGKMRAQIGEVEECQENSSVNDVAQKLWIKANTRPCPQCQVPIEKNDGCNHMTCTNPSCRHEFCWICRKAWKLHGTATGGFFRCNIWQDEDEQGENGDHNTSSHPTSSGDPTDIIYDQGVGTAIHSAREAYRQRYEMGRFLHHYTRWEAHGESAALERRMGETVFTRLAPVVEAAMEFDGSPDFNFGGKGLSFVHSAFAELLECRSVLKHSYAFSFFRYGTLYQQSRRFGQLNSKRREKVAFERLQSELEMMTEQMSDIVARSHLRATQVQIMFLTKGAAEKREEFTNLMFTILSEERKEAKQAKVAMSSGGAEMRSARRLRYALPGGLARVLDESFSEADDERFENERIRASLEDFLPRAVPIDADGADDGVRMWACTSCTYMNSDGRRCAMCGGFRRR